MFDVDEPKAPLTLVCGLDRLGQPHFVYGSLFVWRAAEMMFEGAVPKTPDGEWCTLRFDHRSINPEGLLASMES